MEWPGARDLQTAWRSLCVEQELDSTDGKTFFARCCGPKAKPPAGLNLPAEISKDKLEACIDTIVDPDLRSWFLAGGPRKGFCELIFTKWKNDDEKQK